MISAEREKVLVERSLAGDDLAFDELVRAHGDRLFRLTRYVCGDLPDEADDVFQETFLTAFRKLGRFRRDARLGTWLHRIAANLCLLKRRKKRRERLESLEGRDFPDRSGPEESARREELRASVARALAAVPADYRLVLMLADVEGLPNAETARRLGLSVAAVKSRLHRGRELLRLRFAEALA
ncbi:MAG: sigma-70 family RNA polymerase sigma factor [Elusimicrobia bacterium]|nr:sigma-70 family RNA polymerase sigma factor [Elusimicrobiota bacterium]